MVAWGGHRFPQAPTQMKNRISWFPEMLRGLPLVMGNSVTMSSSSEESEEAPLFSTQLVTSLVVISACLTDGFLPSCLSLDPNPLLGVYLDLELEREWSLDLALEWPLPDLERCLLDPDLERSLLSDLELLLLLLDEGLLLLDVDTPGDGIVTLREVN